MIGPEKVYALVEVQHIGPWKFRSRIETISDKNHVPPSAISIV